MTFNFSTAPWETRSGELVWLKVFSPRPVAPVHHVIESSLAGSRGRQGRGTVLFVLQVFFDGVQLLTQPTITCHPPSARWESTMIEKSKDTGLKVTQLWTGFNVQILSPLLTRWFPVFVWWRWRWPGDSPWYIVTRLQLPRLSWCRAPPPSHNLLVSSTLNK